MYSNYFFHPSHYSNHSLQFFPPGTQSTHHYPAAYPVTFPNYGGYNNNWSPTHNCELLYHANQVLVRELPATALAAMPDENSYQCRWLTGDTPCSQGLANFDDLIVHLGRVHRVQGPAAQMMACQWATHSEPCGRKYRRDGFRRHIGTHVGRRPDPCPECGSSFSREDYLRAHLKKQHGKM